MPILGNPPVIFTIMIYEGVFARIMFAIIRWRKLCLTKRYASA